MHNEPSSTPANNRKLDRIPTVAIPEHELLRCIGAGAFGEVWLAKTVLNIYRAVKIVYRHSFESDAPYEREYKGIKAFEPISRAHEGFVDILQVGRNEEKGYFYYIMEIGDDQQLGQQVLPETYQPKTLKSEKKRLGRMGIDECLHVGISLCQAVGFLHQKGLVHRDIKPSNIIYVHGQVKLADIGLVAEASDDCSFAGTPGFIPQEGPGRPQADIFSLGKVLYEISMGKDRLEFPALPSDFDTGPDHQKYLELTSVIHKACNPVLARRYTTADEVLRELALLQAGSSIQRLRFLEDFVRWVKFGGLALLVIAPLCLLAYRNHQINQEMRLRRSQYAVSSGSQLLQAGNYYAAMPWFVEALEMDRGNAQKELTHRVRIEALLAQCPKLIQCWFQNSQPNYARFSQDGAYLATVNSDGEVIVYDVRSGKVLSSGLFHGRGEGARTVSFSRDGSTLLTAGSDSYARRWDWRNGKEILPALFHTSEVYTAQFSPDDHFVVTGCNDHNAYLWSLDEPGRWVRAFAGHDQRIFCAVFSPDGQRIATASEDYTARIWNVKSGEMELRVVHNSWVFTAAFSPDGLYFVTASFDKTAKIWALGSGALLRTFEHTAGVPSAEFSPDGRYVTTAGYDFAARVWDVATGALANTPLENKGRVIHCAFSPRGDSMVSVSADRTVRMWDLKANKFLPPSIQATFSETGDRYAILKNSVPHFGVRWGDGPQPLSVAYPVQQIILNHEGTSALLLSSTNASGGVQSCAQLWNSSHGSRPLFSCSNGIAQWILSDDGRAAFARDTSTVQRYDTMAAQISWNLPLNAVQDLALTPNGRYLAVLTGTSVRLKEAATGKDVADPLQHACSVVHAEFSRDSRLLVTVCSDASFENRYAQVWTVPEGRPVGARLTHKDGVLYATFSPDGKFVATASEDASASIWDFARGVEVTRPLRHLDEIFTIHYSQDGRWLTTASRDNTCRVWDATTGDPLTPPLKHPSFVRSAQFINEGTAVLTRTSDGSSFIWELKPDQRPLKTLRLLAEFLSGRRISPESKSPDSSRDEFMKAMREMCPNGACEDGANILEWHDRQAEVAERDDQSFAAAFHLTRLLAAHPGDAGLYARRGAAAANLGDLELAEKDLSEANALGATTSALEVQLLRIRLALGQQKNARELFPRLLSQASSTLDPQVVDNLIWTLVLLPDALSDYEPAIKLVTANALLNSKEKSNALKVLGGLQYRANKPEEAIKTLSSTLEQSGRYRIVESWLLLSMAYARAGQTNQAWEFFSRAREWISDNVHARSPFDSGYRMTWQRRFDLRILLAEASQTWAGSAAK